MKKIFALLLLILSVGFVRAQISLTTFSTGYSSPVDIKNCGDNRLFIVEQAGVISICDTDGIRRPNLFLDIVSRVKSGGEQGLLGLAFPADFLTSGYFYVDYTGLTGNTHISRFHVDPATPDSADPNSEELLLEIYQPYTNHNGGHVFFGPDGYLYIGMGDGGLGGDPEHRAQNPDSLLGKMLRLEVNPSYAGYHIPPTNVFANNPTQGRGEIWALGVRNPWRWSFDRATGDLWIADVGQGTVEEIDFQPAGAVSGKNYGWKCWEGNLFYSSATGCQPYSFYTPPVYTYTHSPGGYCSITGGYIYRGSKFQQLYGKYFFADYCNSQIQYLSDTNGALTNTNLGVLGAASVTTFGEDKNGEIYLSSNGNKIMKLISVDCSPVSTINVGADTVSDCGIGSVLLKVPANPDFTYSWTYNSNLISTTATVNVNQAGTYYVTVTNQGCSSTDSIVATFLGIPPSVTFTGLDTFYCNAHNPVILFPSQPGGTFAGSGINGSGFYPSNAGIGTFDITYTLMISGCLAADTQTVRVDACSGIDEELWTNTLSVRPNPSSNLFYLNGFSYNQKSAQVKITDITGRVIMNEYFIFNPGDNDIPLTLNSTAGIYLLQISDDNSSSVIKLVVE